MEETSLDLVGLKCPLPYLKTRKALTKLAPGTVMVVTTTDPLAVIDIPNLCRETGDALEILSREGERTRFRIVKAGPAPA
jgi:tRNA 2-thiouridine synthesizing protein A